MIANCNRRRSPVCVSPRGVQLTRAHAVCVAARERNGDSVPRLGDDKESPMQLVGRLFPVGWVLSHPSSTSKGRQCMAPGKLDDKGPGGGGGRGCGRERRVGLLRLLAVVLGLRRAHGRVGRSRCAVTLMAALGDIRCQSHAEYALSEATMCQGYKKDGKKCRREKQPSRDYCQPQHDPSYQRTDRASVDVYNSRGDREDEIAERDDDEDGYTRLKVDKRDRENVHLNHVGEIQAIADVCARALDGFEIRPKQGDHFTERRHQRRRQLVPHDGRDQRGQRSFGGW